MPYKLSAALYGHSLDVRALAVTSDGRIVSASRDKTAKVWKPNLHNAGFCEEQTLKGHSKFVSSVCVLPASEILPGGLILTGSNDNTICAFRNGETEPAFVLTGHTNAVCCLSASTNPKTPSIVLSSSWDQTAKVWCLGGGGGGGEALLTLSGHQAAVWSVLQLSGGHIVTASADKTIRTYTAEGQHQKTITGHTDCVRDLAVTQSPTEFLSCANDATIRKWKVLTGECLNTFYGHPHYIYSLSALPSGLVVSGGEDRSVMVWSQGGSQQESITLPAQSVWAVALLPNGDVVTGSSDGVVRVFSCEVSRQADEVTLAQFEEEIAALTRAASQEVGGVKVSELPGKEALLAAGKSDGQTKMVQEDGVATVYSWSAEQQQWLKVGTAMGAVGPNNPETGRTTFNGKEYDYVFSVDIEDGAPPLKLPYNNGQDPWHAAQAFIHRNNLNQQFLEQIANFIITNSKKPEPVVLNQAAGAATGYCDPFTGGARYIPEGVGAAPATQQPLSNGNTSSKNDSGPTLFPQTTYLKFDAGNLELIKDKLLEFNKDPTRSVDNDSLESLLRLAESDVEPTNEALNTLQKLLEWPDNFLIPVLDLLRMCLRNSQPNRALSSPSTQRCNHLFGVLIRQLSSGAASNRALALRCVVNMMVHGGGEEAVGERRQQLLPLVEECIGGLAAVADGKSTHLQTALSTTLLNFVILAIKERDSTTQTHLVRMLQTLLPLLGNAEAQLRALVALGTLLSSAAGNDQLIASCLDAVTLDTLMGLSSKEEGGQGQVGKVALCSRQIVERFVV